VSTASPRWFSLPFGSSFDQPFHLQTVDFGRLFAARPHLRILSGAPTFAPLRFSSHLLGELRLAGQVPRFRRLRTISRELRLASHAKAQAQDPERTLVPGESKGRARHSQTRRGQLDASTGTRVPVQTLLESLERGESIDDFLDGFPSVTRAQVAAFLEEGKQLLVAKVS
jgi:hypothetical protein